MSFFEECMMGTILNRCSEDMAELDHVVHFTLRSMINCILGAAGTFGIILEATPKAVFGLLPLMAVYGFVQVLKLLQVIVFTKLLPTISIKIFFVFKKMVDIPYESTSFLFFFSLWCFLLFIALIDRLHRTIERTFGFSLSSVFIKILPIWGIIENIVFKNIFLHDFVLNK